MLSPAEKLVANSLEPPDVDSLRNWHFWGIAVEKYQLVNGLPLRWPEGKRSKSFQIHPNPSKSLRWSNWFHVDFPWSMPIFETGNPPINCPATGGLAWPGQALCRTGAFDQDAAEVATASTMDRSGECQRRCKNGGWGENMGKHMCKRAEKVELPSGKLWIFSMKTCDFNWFMIRFPGTNCDVLPSVQFHPLDLWQGKQMDLIGTHGWIERSCKLV